MALLLAMVADTMVAQGHSELVSCGNGVYLLVRDNGYVVVYAAHWLDEDEAVQIALDCIQMIEVLSLAGRVPLTLQFANDFMQDLKQLEKAVKSVTSASGQTATQNIYTVQKTGKQKTTTCVAVTHYVVKHSIPPTASLLLVVLCVLLGYFLSKLILGRVLSG